MRVTKEKAAENRERILTEAARLFRERGVSAVGMDALAEAAGMTHGSLYSSTQKNIWRQKRWVVPSMPVLPNMVRSKLFPHMSNAICHRAIGTLPETVVPLRPLAARSLARAMQCGRRLRRDFDA
jgi:hypothetical protein